VNLTRSGPGNIFLSHHQNGQESPFDHSPARVLPSESATALDQPEITACRAAVTGARRIEPRAGSEQGTASLHCCCQCGRTAPTGRPQSDTCELAFRNSRIGASYFIAFSPSLDLDATQRRFWDLDQFHNKMEQNRGSKWHHRLARKYYHEGPCHRGYGDGQRDIGWPNAANSYHRPLRPIFPKRNLRLVRARQPQQEPRRKSFSLFPPR
jgi:hypothetical protein